MKGGVFKWPYLSRQQNHTLGVDQIKVENEQGVVKRGYFHGEKMLKGVFTELTFFPFALILKVGG